MFYGPVNISYDDLDSQTEDTLQETVTGLLVLLESVLHECSRRGIHLPMDINPGKEYDTRDERPFEQTEAYARGTRRKPVQKIPAKSKKKAGKKKASKKKGRR